MNKELIERLRAKCKMLHQCVKMRREAANALEAADRRIEELEDVLRTIATSSFTPTPERMAAKQALAAEKMDE